MENDQIESTLCEIFNLTREQIALADSMPIPGHGGEKRYNRNEAPGYCISRLRAGEADYLCDVVKKVLRGKDFSLEAEAMENGLTSIPDSAGELSGN